MRHHDVSVMVAAGSPGSARWLRAETLRLLEFAAGSRHPVTGFGWQDDAGAIDPAEPVELWITGRMTHVFALGVLDGHPQYAPLVAHGVGSLLAMRDPDGGGWHGRVGPAGPEPGPKQAHACAFVILAAASASLAGDPQAPELLGQALEHLRARFLDAGGMAVDSWDQHFSTLDPYRGINANMHAVEAFLAAADATGDPSWLARALIITNRIVHVCAAGNEYRMPEHYDQNWQPLLDLNRENPADPFRPYGASIGKAMEWARLCLHLHHALGLNAPPWLAMDAQRLFKVAIQDGWAADGESGLVYTTDWAGKPVVHQRMHWVVAEAAATAAALYDFTGRRQYQQWYSRCWQWIDARVIDREGGSWRHELDQTLAPASTVWRGKPDAYHAVQATIIPRRPLGVSVAGSLTTR